MPEHMFVGNVAFLHDRFDFLIFSFIRRSHIHGLTSPGSRLYDDHIIFLDMRKSSLMSTIDVWKIRQKKFVFRSIFLKFCFRFACFFSVTAKASFEYFHDDLSECIFRTYFFSGLIWSDKTNSRRVNAILWWNRTPRRMKKRTDERTHVLNKEIEGSW